MNCADCNSTAIAGRDRGDPLCFQCQLARLIDYQNQWARETKERGVTPIAPSRLT